MGAKAKRTALASALQSGLPSGWAVYASPPESLVAQSAVISPRSPYVTRITNGIEEVKLQVALLVNLAAGPVALDILDDAIDALFDDIDGAGDVMLEEVADVGVATEVGGADYITATINLTIL